MPDDPATLADALAEIRELRQLLARQAPARRLTRDDHRRALLLVPIVAAIIDGRAFTVRELLRWAGSDLPGAGELRRAIETGTGRLDNGTGRRVGKLLKRLDGAEVAGVVVARIGSEAAGCVWSLRPAGFPHTGNPCT